MLCIGVSTIEAQVSAAQQAYLRADYQKAVDHIEQLMSSDAKIPAEHYKLAADIYAAKAKEDSFNNGYLEQAIAYYNRSLEEAGDPYQGQQIEIAQENLWKEISVLAARQEEKGHYHEALSLLEKAKKVLPREERTYLLSGKLAFGLKDYRRAEENFEYLVDSLL